MNCNLSKSVALARYCTFRELKNMMQNTYALGMKARVNKHQFKGKVLSRRDSKDEKAHGSTKHYMSILSDAKVIKKNWTMEDVSNYLEEYKDAFNYTTNIKKELRANYNKKEMI